MQVGLTSSSGAANLPMLKKNPSVVLRQATEGVTPEPVKGNLMPNESYTNASPIATPEVLWASPVRHTYQKPRSSATIPVGGQCDPLPFFPTV